MIINQDTAVDIQDLKSDSDKKYNPSKKSNSIYEFKNLEEVKTKEE